MLLNSKSNFRLNSLIAVILSFCIFFTLPSISNAATSGNGMVSRSDSISKSVKASTITISKRYFYFNSDKYTIKEFSKILRNSSVNFYSIDVADSTSNHIISTAATATGAIVATCSIPGVGVGYRRSNNSGRCNIG